MIEISVKVEGTAETALKLGKVTIPVLARRPMERNMIMLQGDMATYPPQRPATKYVRTGTLGRRWTYAVTVTSDSVTGKIGNNTAYAPFVQAKRFQAAVHKGHWQTDEDVLARRIPVIVRNFEEGIRMAIREIGL